MQVKEQLDAMRENVMPALRTGTIHAAAAASAGLQAAGQKPVVKTDGPSKTPMSQVSTRATGSASSSSVFGTTADAEA